MRIDQSLSRSVAVIAPLGRLDSTTAALLESVLTDVRLTAVPALVIDLVGLSHLSSAGLRLLVRAARAAQARRCRLVLAGLAPQVFDMFEICGLTPLFTVHPDRASALASVDS